MTTLSPLEKDMQRVYAAAFEDGYQKGLYDGLKAAHENSNGRTLDPDSPSGKRVVATGRSTPDGIQFDQVDSWAGMIDEMAVDATLESFLMGARYGG